MTICGNLSPTVREQNIKGVALSLAVHFGLSFAALRLERNYPHRVDEAQVRRQLN